MSKLLQLREDFEDLKLEVDEMQHTVRDLRDDLTHATLLVGDLSNNTKFQMEMTRIDLRLRKIEKLLDLQC